MGFQMGDVSRPFSLSHDDADATFSPSQTRIRMETRRMLHHSQAGPTRARRGDKRATRTDSDGVGPDPGLQP